ncbi:carbonic anhydrase [Bifidobacterium sp.]|uniref:carbonic anhydrase n=2 Tax=Bifidobacterium sp. TaxID=41200 RepID=UPI0034211C75
MLAGNRRFSQGTAEHPWQDGETRESLIDAQHPDAAVLSCSDSRVPPEIIFDQGLGDMFTIRTAGEVLDAAVVASLEFAVETLNVSLLVVLGHEHCGAVASTVAQLNAIINATTLDGESDLSQVIADSDSIIMRSVGASVETARNADLDSTGDFERVHVARTIEALVARSETIRQALAEQRLLMVGARYKVTTGKVEVLSF